ncbi:hypothetical protein [Nocardioides speluncae]|uniref:hypothetical protein n=1 Tax=Nocardioides speluncae TaxID=2670337 RepID=UPI001F0C3C07|nr:hypothetical protein [Nocardioides speluncae]
MGRVAVAAIVAVAVVFVAIGFAVYREVGSTFFGDDCTAEVGDQEVGLETEQAENAALIAAIGVERGLPARAVTIALATAIQESKLVNIDYGDRDSLGLFQQRPSQGWGTEEEILNPLLSTHKFYDALVEVDDYLEMSINDAAQEVQRSGHPDAYADHSVDAQTLSSALTGRTPEAFACDVQRGGDGPTELTKSGLTERADQVRRELRAVFGKPPMGGFAPGGVQTGHMPGSAHYEGRAVDVFVRPVSKQNRRLGWAMAHYLMAQADRLKIEHIIFDDRIWSAGLRSGKGWRDYDPPSSSGDMTILEHRDHVHVDVG